MSPPRFACLALSAAACLDAGVPLAWSAPMSPAAAFEAVHVERSATFTVALPPAHAFQLFTPEGERLWAHGWDPEYLHPRSGEPAPGMVFRTTNHAVPTTWYVVRCDPAAGELEYLHFQEGVRMGTVSVKCAPAGEAGASVAVTYRLTALSEAGNKSLREMTPEAFGDMIRAWGEHIAMAIAAHPRAGH